MEEEDDVFTDAEQAIRDRIDDEIVNRDLLERLDAYTGAAVTRTDHSDRDTKSGSRRR